MRSRPRCYVSLSDQTRRLVADDHACATMLARIRWPSSGFTCSRCGHTCAYRLKSRPRVFVCTACRHHHSVTAGTAMHKSRVKLGLWVGIALVLGTNPNTSTQQLALAFRMHYATAYYIVQKVRAAVRASEPTLTGLVDLATMPLATPLLKRVFKPRVEPLPADVQVLVTVDDAAPMGHGPVGYAWSARPSAALAPGATTRTGSIVCAAQPVRDAMVARLWGIHRGVSYRWSPRYLRFYAWVSETRVRGPLLAREILRQLTSAPHVAEVDLAPP